MTAEAKSADEQPAPEMDLEGLKRLKAEIEARQRAEAGGTTAAATRAKSAAEPTPQPKLAQTAPTIREYLDSCPIRAFHAQILESCRKHGISLDSRWPPPIPEESKPEPQPAPEPTAKLIQLDFWEDGRRAAPNIVFRSALFPALKFKEGRPFLKQERLFSTKGGEVFFTGEQFDQSDLDVYLEILQFARSFPLGTPVKFSAYSMLKVLGRNTGKSDHEWLHAVLIRLCGGVVDMTDHKKRYVGGLIHSFIKDEITIDPKFAVLFGFGMWSTIDKEQRRALKRNQTAKALHVYYSSHAAPLAHTYEKLAELAGLKNQTSRNLRANIIKAHEAMKQIGFMPDYEAGTKTIAVKINHTSGQNHHIVKKIIKSRNRKRTPRNAK